MEIHPHSGNLSNNSVEYFDFWASCNNRQDGTYIWAASAFLCFLVGFPASVTVLWEFFKTHRGGASFTPNDVFMLNLTVMDLIFLLFIPPGLYNHFFMKKWLVEATWNTVYALNICGRPLLMACICADCYLAVVHPIRYRERKSLTPRVLVSVGVWMITTAIGIAYFFNYELYFTACYIMPYIISVLIIGICDFFILQALKRSKPGGKGTHPQKQRAIHTITNSLVMAAISYLPPTFMTVIGKPLITTRFDYICYVALPSLITSTAGSAVMPILHLHNLGKLNPFGFRCCKNA